MAQQYGTVKVDVITYTSGTGGSETDQSITVSSLATISRTGIIVTGDIEANNITANSGLNVGGLADVSGLVVGNDATITGNLTVGSGIQTSSLVVQDDATVSGDLNVTGLLTTSGLLVTGNIETSGDLFADNFYTSTGATNSNFGQPSGRTRLNISRESDPSSNNNASGFIQGFVGEDNNYQAFYFTSSGRLCLNGTDPRMSNATPSVQVFSFAEGETAPRLAITDIRTSGVGTLSPGYIFGCPSGAFGEVLGLIPSGSGIDAGRIGIRAGGVNAANEKLTILGNTPASGTSGCVGINITAPECKLTVNDSGTTKALYDTTMDSSLFLIGGSGGASGSFGASVGFSRHDGTRNRKVAEIITKQHTTDSDQCGLSFFTHPSTNTNSNLFEALTIDHQGHVGINDVTPSTKLVVRDESAANDTPEIVINSFRPALRFEDRSSGQIDSEIVGDNALRFRIAFPSGSSGTIDDPMVERLRLNAEGSMCLFQSGSTAISNSDNFAIRRSYTNTTSYGVRLYSDIRSGCTTVVGNQFVYTATQTGDLRPSGMQNIYAYDALAGTVVSGGYPGRTIGYHCAGTYAAASVVSGIYDTFATFLNIADTGDDNVWNLYSAGSAPNFMNGRLGIGTSTPRVSLSIGSTTTGASGTLSGYENTVAYLGYGSTSSNNFGGIVIGAGPNGNSPFVGSSRAQQSQSPLPLRLMTAGSTRVFVNGTDGYVSFPPDLGGTMALFPNSDSVSPSILLNRPVIHKDASGITILFDTIGATYESGLSPSGTVISGGTLYHYRARGANTLPPTRELGNETCFFADSRSTRGESNYGFRANFPANLAGSNYNIYADGTALNYFGGIVGIGQNNPQGGLHVQSTNATNASIVTAISTTQATHTNRTLKVRNNSAASTFEVSFLGNIYASNTTVQPISSERRLKDNIVEFDSSTSWDVVKGLQIREYNYLETPDQKLQGYIVDEIEPIDSSLIVDTGKKDEVGPIRSYNNTKVTAHYHSALKQALVRIEDLEDRLSKLELN